MGTKTPEAQGILILKDEYQDSLITYPNKHGINPYGELCAVYERANDDYILRANRVYRIASILGEVLIQPADYQLLLAVLRAEYDRRKWAGELDTCARCGMGFENPLTGFCYRCDSETVIDDVVTREYKLRRRDILEKAHIRVNSAGHCSHSVMSYSLGSKHSQRLIIDARELRLERAEYERYGERRLYNNEL